jgi:hypothetical protein
MWSGLATRVVDIYTVRLHARRVRMLRPCSPPRSRNHSRRSPCRLRGSLPLLRRAPTGRYRRSALAGQCTRATWHLRRGGHVRPLCAIGHGKIVGGTARGPGPEDAADRSKIEMGCFGKGNLCCVAGGRKGEAPPSPATTAVAATAAKAPISTVAVRVARNSTCHTHTPPASASTSASARRKRGIDFQLRGRGGGAGREGLTQATNTAPPSPPSATSRNTRPLGGCRTRPRRGGGIEVAAAAGASRPTPHPGVCSYAGWVGAAMFIRHPFYIK